MSGKVKKNKYLYDLMYKEQEYTREYLFNLLVTDMCLFDMRLWDKPKKELTTADIISWIMCGCVPSNAGHATQYIQECIMRGIVTPLEVAERMLQNKRSIEENKLGQYSSRVPDSSFFYWVGYSDKFMNWLQSQSISFLI